MTECLNDKYTYMPNKKTINIEINKKKIGIEIIWG